MGRDKTEWREEEEGCARVRIAQTSASHDLTPRSEAQR